MDVTCATTVAAEVKQSNVTEGFSKESARHFEICDSSGQFDNICKS